MAGDLQQEGLQAFVDIDRDAAARLGIQASAIAEALYDAFGQRQISTIFTHANQYRVVLEADAQYQIGPEAIGRIHVATADGGHTPLDGIARIGTRTAPLLRSHIGQFPAALPEPLVAQHVGHKTIGVGGDDLGTGVDIGLMRLTHVVGGFDQRQRRPLRQAKWGAQSFEQTSHAAVENGESSI